MSHSRCLPTYDPPRPTTQPILTYDPPRPTTQPILTYDPPRGNPEPMPMPTVDILPPTEINFAINFQENSKNHHTEDYEGNIVLRRGGKFKVDVLNIPGYLELKTLSFELRTGEKPSRRNGTLIKIKERDRSTGDEHDDYWFEITSNINMRNVDPLNFTATIFIPAHALVSSYKLMLSTEAYDGRKTVTLAEDTLYVIFNPWNEDDEVYMEDEDLKKEYVLNDSGYICTGAQRPKPWNFAQFTDAALKCTFKLLESAGRVTMRDTARDVARYMTKMANNCANRNGLLYGRWDGEYSDGTKPWQWAGSHYIFKEYLNTGQPVKYGQCWVFSGLTTSMMRCLGIPVRSVSNYASAHDKDRNCTYDKYFDEDGNELPDEEGNPDSIWNFHVWNDVWMARPDLKPGMGGWQAIDGTPQEESQGAFQCGPTPLLAIKEGDIYTPFDTRFLFSEVNADRVNWIRYPNGDEKVLDVFPSYVGTALMTKVPNRRAVEDIMDQYKYPEGSDLERAVVKKVMKKVDNPVVLNQPKDFDFNVRVPFIAMIDEEGYPSIALKVYAKNKKSQPLTVNVFVIPDVLRYNGVKLATLDKMTAKETVSGREDRSLKFKFETGSIPSQFMDEVSSVRFTVFAKVVETGQVWISQEMCNISKKEVKVELVDNDDGQVFSKEQMTVRIHIPKIAAIRKYTNCYLSVESRLVDDVRIQLKDADVNSHCGYVDQSFEVQPFWSTRTCDFNVTFNSSEISGVDGSMEVTVGPERRFLPGEEVPVMMY